jgi:hypothetical protein
MTTMSRFATALAVLNDMKAAGVVQEYAVAGAMAIVFWSEPVPTYDLDVLVWLPPSFSSIVTLSGIYQWLAARGYRADAEHVIVEQLPVQFLPAHNALADEALRTAATLDYQGVAVRVVRPEHLIALYLEAGARTPRRRERAALLAESPHVDQQRLRDLLERHGLEF